MGKRFLSATSMFKCTLGAVPMPAMPSRKHIKIQGMTVMSTSDTDFVKSFGMCMVTRTPCTPKLTQWAGFVSNITLKGSRALTMDSFIMCALGGKVAPETSGQRVARNEGEKIVCSLCGKDVLEHKFLIGTGNNVGHSEILGNNILQGKEKNSHKFAVETNNMSQHRILIGHGIAAHHLICSEAMNAKVWAKICKELYYDIDKRENGVYLPAEMDLACHLHVALHRGNHADGFADGFERYADSVKNKLDEIKSSYTEIKPCDEKKSDQLNAQLDALSKDILGKINDFKWTITMDGRHYKSGNLIGCSNCKSIPQKKKKRAGIKQIYNTTHMVKITIKQMEEDKIIRAKAFTLYDKCECKRFHEEFKEKPTKNELIISS